MKSSSLSAYDKRAKYYDVEFADTSDHELLAFVTGRAERILEVPCGSGRNVEWLAVTGKSVVFGDLSPKMIAIVAAKLKDLPLPHRARAVRMDMTHFAQDPFDAIIVPREGFQLLPRELAPAALAAFQKHLTPNGLLYLDIARFDLGLVAHPNVLPQYIAVQGDDYSKDIDTHTANAHLMRWHRSHLVNNTLHVSFRYRVDDGDGHDEYESKLELAAYSFDDLQHLTQDAGLHITACWGGYDRSPLTTASPRILLVLQKGATR